MEGAPGPKNLLSTEIALLLAAAPPQDCGKPFFLNNYLAFFGAIRAKYPHMVRGSARLHLLSEVNSNLFAYLNNQCLLFGAIRAKYPHMVRSCGV